MIVLRWYVYAVRFLVVVTCAALLTLLTWVPDKILGEHGN